MQKAKAKGKAARTGSSLWRILGAVVTLAAAIGLPMFHANVLMDFAMRNAFPGYEVGYRSTWPRLGGGMTASDVSILPFGDDDTEVFRFNSVTVSIPFLEFYTSMFKRIGMLKEIHNVSMVFEGGHGTMTAPFVGDLAAFGNVSLSPFEAEGCMLDSQWVDEEFADMGLKNEPLTMTLSWSRDDGRFVVEQNLSKPGVGQLQHRAEMSVHDEEPLLSLYETGLDQPISDEWHVRDEGFVAARNRHCARKDRVDAREFVDRHLLTVKRTLEAVGLAPDAELEAAYRTFATRGGTLDLKLAYRDQAQATDDEDDAVNLGALLDYVTGGFTIGGRDLGLAMKQVAIRDLPDGDDELTTFALVQKEIGVTPTVTAAAVEPTAVPSVAAPAPVAAVAVKSTPLVAEVTPVAIEPPAPATDAPTEPTTTISDYRELGKQVGQQFVIHFKAKPPMRFQIVGIDGGLVKVRRRMQSGWAEHTLDRAAFDHAEPVR